MPKPDKKNKKANQPKAKPVETVKHPKKTSPAKFPGITW